MDTPQAGRTDVTWKQDLRVALAWALLAALSAIALIPYLQQTMPGAFDTLRIPFPAFVAIQAVQAFVLLGALSLLGLRMGHRVELGSPVMHDLLNRRTKPDWRALKPVQAIVLGIAASVFIIGLSAVLDPMLP